MHIAWWLEAETICLPVGDFMESVFRPNPRDFMSMWVDMPLALADYLVFGRTPLAYLDPDCLQTQCSLNPVFAVRRGVCEGRVNQNPNGVLP